MEIAKIRARSGCGGLLLSSLAEQGIARSQFLGEAQGIQAQLSTKRMN